LASDTNRQSNEVIAMEKPERAVCCHDAEEQSPDKLLDGSGVMT
jgi:hypothetical protein